MTNHLYDALSKHAVASPETLLLIETGKGKLTNRDFFGYVGAIAERLSGAGIVAGNRVAILAHKSILGLAAYLAIIRAGATIIPLNPAYTDHELEFMLHDSRPHAVITNEEDSERQPVVLARDRGASIVSLDKDDRLISSSRQFPCGYEIARRGPDDIAAILFSSGTTGKPKGVMLSHDSLLSNAASLTRTWQFSSSDTLLHTLPIFHLHGLFVATNVALLSGCRLLFIEKFAVDTVLEAMPGATTMMGVPTYYRRLMSSRGLDGTCLEHFRLFISGSAPLQPDIAREWQERTGHVLVNRYGMTEANIITSNPCDGGIDPCSVGKPLAGTELRIRCTGSGELAKADQPGMLEIKGPGLFKGYWEMPEATRDAFQPDGYFITGDLARLDGHGNLHIEGRSQDLIITGGLNVYPAEVENVINGYPDVKDSAVIGVSHPDYGESPVAIIVTSDESRISTGDLDDYLRERLAGYKLPKIIKLRKSLPRNAMEKVDRNALRREYSGLFVQ